MQSICAFSQKTDTIYYNANWKKTTKPYAHFFRPIPQQNKDSLFLIKDYYINGTLQMEGLSTSDTKDIFKGKVTWYTKNGTKSITRNYINGKLEGNVISYFKDGTVKTSGTYTNNTYHNGTFIYTCDCPFKVSKYKNGSITERLSFYKDTKTVAEKKYIQYFSETKASVYFDKKGNKIANIDYINKSGNYLEPKAGTIIHFSYTDDYFVKDIIAKTIVSVKNDVKQEITTTPDGKIIASGTRKDGYPFEGVFLNKGTLTTYKNGERDGEERCCIDNSINTLGYYKNNTKFNGTFYDKRKRTITAYKNAALDGEKIVYDATFKIIASEQYKNGVLNGKRITQNKFDKTSYSAKYKNGAIVDGKVFNFDNLEIYENGMLIEKTYFDYKTELPKETVYYNTKGDITKKQFLKDNDTYILTYKDGIPFEGIEIQPFGSVTYKNGVYEGPFIIYDRKQTIRGNYKNFKHHGLVVFINTKTQDTLKCTFRDGKPIDGINAFNGNIGYKNGLKHGLYAKNFNNRNYKFDSLSVYYKKNIKIDTISYFKKQKRVAFGIYKNGTPYHGTFYDEKQLQNFEVYKNGVITKREVLNYYDKYRHQFLYIDNSLAQENVYYFDINKDSLAYQLAYKNNLPYVGSAFQKDSLTNVYCVTNYLKGKKEGLQTFYKKPFQTFTKRFTYKNNFLDGKAQYQYIYNKDRTTEGIYKNNIPFSGSFITEYNGFIEVASYKKSKLQKKAYYTYSKYSNKQDAIDSISYKQKKPQNGLELSFNVKKLIAKRYKDGKHIRTDFSPSLHPYRIYRSCIHTALKDSLAGNSNYKYVIDYKTTKKISGVVNYFYRDTLYGTLKFNKNLITAVDVDSFNDYNAEKYIMTLYFNTKGELINEIQQNSVKIQRKVPLKIIGDIPAAIGNLQRLQFNYPKATFTFFLDGKAYNTLELRDTKPYHGIMFEPNRFDDTYKYRVYNNGMLEEDLKNLTKSELLTKLGFKKN